MEIKKRAAAAYRNRYKVSLKGSGFQSYVATGDRVSAGQTLIEFDLEAVRAAGLPVISPVIVTSMEETPPELECLYGLVRSGQDLILRVASRQ